MKYAVIRISNGSFNIEKANEDKRFFENKLNNKGFISKAPEAVIKKKKEGLEKVLQRIALINGSIDRLKK